MTYEQFNAYCQSLKATTHVVQWGNAHVWKVGGKVFAIGGWSKDKQPAFTFKTSDVDYAFLQECECYQHAPYFANRGMKWIQQFESQAKLDDDLKYYISESYKIVSLGLTKTKQKELGLNQD